MNCWQIWQVGVASRHLLQAFGTLVLLALASARGDTSPPAEETGTAFAARDARQQLVADELKELNDPTILKRRLWLDSEWNKYDDGSDTVEETLAALWAWNVSPRQDWAVRLKVPYKWSFAGEDAPGSNENGLGDLKLATGTAFRLSETWRAGGGLELRMPTAADDLGDSDWRLQEFAALAWDATPWLTVSPSAEYNHSIAELNNAQVRDYLEVYFPVTFLLPHDWGLTADYEAKIDFENDNHVTHSAKLQIARQFETLPLGLALSVKKPFDGGSKDFQLNFVISYFFP